MIEAFLAARPEARGCLRTALEERLARALDEARAAWPTLGVPPASFARHLGERARGEDPLSVLDRLHTSDLYLACGCAAGEPAALAAFAQAHLARIGGYVRRVQQDDAFAAEVRQLVAERVLVATGARPARIAGYSGQGSLASWVRVASVRTAMNLRRSAAPERQRELESADAVLPDPELDYARRHDQEIFRKALAEAVAALPVRDRNFLRLHFVEGVTLDQLGTMYHLSRATIARRLVQARATLERAVRSILARELHVEGDDLDSLVRMIRSHLQLRLSQIFGAQGG